MKGAKTKSHLMMPSFYDRIKKKNPGGASKQDSVKQVVKDAEQFE